MECLKYRIENLGRAIEIYRKYGADEWMKKVEEKLELRALCAPGYH